MARPTVHPAGQATFSGRSRWRGEHAVEPERFVHHHPLRGSRTQAASGKSPSIPLPLLQYCIAGTMFEKNTAAGGLKNLPAAVSVFLVG